METYDRRVSKFGNSFGVTLPIEVLKEIGLSQGDDVQIAVEGEKIVLRKKGELNLPEGISSEFMDVLNQVIDEHSEAFKGLVDR